ncbi:MAG: RNA polymerase sigma factor [Candidatus Staskawiczbacteria bacterium]|nr:RNA polymerase sigma factor [Candidatus Staskawiczbacteria bacterium]
MKDLKDQFGEIYDQYIEKIYRFVFLKVSSREIAEDITSKVFLKGWESYQKKGAEIKNPSAFLYQIARNAVVDHYREKGRNSTVSSEVLPEIADFGDNVHEKAVLSADISAVRVSIQKLKPEHQDVIIWHYLEDMPIADIAKLLGKPAGTVRVMLHRGLKELKGIVEEA